MTKGELQKRKAMKDYFEKVKELKKLGENILDEGLDNKEFLKEVDRMDMYLDCCVSELEKSL